MLKVNYQLSVNPYPADEQAHLSAEQLWSGLVLRVLEPLRFTLGLDDAKIEQMDQDNYQRVLFFGDNAIRDRVALTEQRSIRFVTEATERAPSGELYYEIQEHPTEGLMLHCEYVTAFPEPNSDEEKQLLAMIQNAYRMADEDMLRIIREYSQEARH